MKIIKTLILVSLFYNFQNLSAQSIKNLDSIDPLNCFKTEKKIKYEKLHIELEDYKWIRNIVRTIKKSDQLVKLYKNNNIRLHYPPILPKYKKWQKANIKYTYKNGIICSGSGKIRLTGDFTDHINKKNYIASFALKLDDISINNNTKFKVFYPPSRRNAGEIFINEFLQEFNFLTPDSRMINVEFGKIAKIKMILQDDINKEFLEKNERVEGPIIESNEYIKYQFPDKIDELKKFPVYDVSFALPKIKNSKWSMRSKNNFNDSLVAMNLLYPVYFDNIEKHGENRKSRSNIHANFNYLYTDTKKKILQLDCLAGIIHLPHLSILSNRIFYYNMHKHIIEPIVYDTNFTYRELKKNQIKKDYNKKNNCEIESLKEIKEIFKKIDKISFFEKLKEKGINSNQAKEIYKIIENNFENYKANKKNKILNKHHDLNQESLDNFFRKYYDYNKQLKFKILISQDATNFLICEIDKKCKNSNLNENDKRKALDGELFKEDTFYQLISTKKYNLKSFYSKNNINIFTIGSFIKLFVDEDKSTIDIITDDRHSQVLFRNSNLNSFNINYNFVLNEKNDFNSKLDTNLRGCVNFYNTRFESLKLNVSNCNIEDSVNFVSSSGQIDTIDISNTSSDALDADFSNITYNKIIIKNAGNDCLDFSFGDYLIQEALLTECGDKGISVGEQSKLEITKAKIEKTQMGLASKDEASVSILNRLDITDIEVCYQSYRKKQEFDVGNIFNKNKIFCD